MKNCLRQSGFTLAELLIALAILGVIATFTIPKILDSGSSSKQIAIAKEFASTLSGAYMAVKKDGNLSASTAKSDLTPYFNYVRLDTTSIIDDRDSGSTAGCNNPAARTCLLFHNGAIAHFSPFPAFGDTSNTSAIGWQIDTVSGSNSGVGEDSVQFWIYYNGRITSRANLVANTYTNGSGPFAPAADPPWFSWSN